MTIEQRPGGSGSGGEVPPNSAPDDASFVTTSASAGLTNEQVTTDSASNTWDNTTPGQIKVVRAAITGAITIPVGANDSTLSDNAVTSAKILDGAVVTNKLGTAVVTQAKLADASVGTAQLIDGNVTNLKLATDAVGTTNIVNGNVTTAKLADANVTTAKIADLNVTTGKIADNAVGNSKSAKITANAVKCNPTATLANGTDLVINELSLFGRATGGTLGNIPVGTGLAIVAGSLVNNAPQDPDTVLFKKVGGVIVGFKTVAGVDVPVVSYDVSTLTDFFALVPANINGQVVRLLKSALTGDGAQDTFWISDGINLLPFGGRQLLFKNQVSTVAAHACQVTAANTRFPISADPVIPGGMIAKRGMGIECVERIVRIANVGTMIYKTTFGTSATLNANASVLQSTLGTSAANLTIAFRYFIERQDTANKLMTTFTVAENGNGGASIIRDLTTNVDFAADQIVSHILTTNSVPEACDLLNHAIWVFA